MRYNLTIVVILKSYEKLLILIYALFTLFRVDSDAFRCRKFKRCVFIVDNFVDETRLHIKE